MLELSNVRKRFGDREVLRGIDLKVEDGDVVALIGPSGSGKTTLLRCANFLERADEGTMVFRGETYDLPKTSRRDIRRMRQHTGFVFQSYNLFANRTALGNVTEGLVVARKMRKAEAADRAMEALRRVGLADWASHYPSQLSGGQQQRVAIARAIALEPDIIFFDEPTSALDPELIGEVLGVMRDLAESGMTMLVVTHEMTFASEVSGRTVFMEDGRIVEERRSREFFSDPHTERARQFLRAIGERE